MSGAPPDDPSRALQAALGELERRLKRRRPPTRFEARAVLLALGALVEARSPEVALAKERLGRLVEPVAEAWREAVAEELSLAIAEHVHGVDPRHLDHPRYDFEYTLAARERLEHRLRAASALDLDPAEGLLELVAGADAVLAEALAHRKGTDGS